MEQDLKVQVCRLCFGFILDEKLLHITGSLKDMLQVITTDLNLDATVSPVMCSECSKSIEDLFSFKTNFFETEEVIEAKIADKNTKLDLADIMNYSSKSRVQRKSARVKLKNMKLCRICLRKIKNEGSIFLGKNTDIFLTLMLESCFAELDLNITSDPVMCQKCYKILQKMYMFRTMCKENESKIESYVSTVGIGSQKTVNLHSVIQFLCNTESKIDIPEQVGIPAAKTGFENCNELVKSEDNFDFAGEYRFDNCLQYIMVKMETADEEHKSEEEKLNETCIMEDSGLKTVQIKQESANEGCRIKQEKDHIHLNYNIADKSRNKHVEVDGDKNLISSKHQKITNSKGVRQKRTTNKIKMKSIAHCHMCKFKTSYNYNLRRHLSIFHKHQSSRDHIRQNVELKKKFYSQCSHCNFSARYKMDLTRHMLLHIKPEDFQCKRCPYNTDQNSLLVRHILSHINDDNKGKPSFFAIKKEKSIT